MRFFTKHINPRSLELWWIQDWVFKSERIGKLILRFFTKQINPRSYGSWCVKGTKKPFWKWILRLLWRTMSWEKYISNYVKRKKKWIEFNWIEFNWIERTWIDVFSKETQNPFSDSFGFKNPILDFLKEMHPKCEKCLVEKYCWNEPDDVILPVLHNFSELWYLFPWVATGYCLLLFISGNCLYV